MKWREQQHYVAHSIAVFTASQLTVNLQEGIMHIVKLLKVLFRSLLKEYVIGLQTALDDVQNGVFIYLVF